MWNYALVRALTTLGHRVTVVTARHAEQIPAFEIRDGITFHRLLLRDRPRWRRIPLLGRYVREALQLAYARRVDKQLRILHRVQPFDVVEFADVNAEGFFYARRPETAVVVRCHTPTFVLKRYFQPAEMPYDTRLIGACEKDSIRRAVALTAPSRDMARVIADACALANGSICVIPNPLPAELLQAPAPPSKTDAFTALYVGRFERVKGIAILAAAIPRVVKQFPHARFIFAGYDRPTPRGTSQQAELEHQLVQAGARDNVEFLGAVEQAELAALYQTAAVCIVPSLLYESFSYTCAQAMAAGRAVIASRIGGIPETVTDGVTGLLFEPGDADALANAILELAENPARRIEMGEQGRAKAVREFDPMRVAEETLGVYKTVAFQN